MTCVVFKWMNNLCKCSPPLTGAIFISIWDYQIHVVTVGVYLKKKHFQQTRSQKGHFLEWFDGNKNPNLPGIVIPKIERGDSSTGNSLQFTWPKNMWAFASVACRNFSKFCNPLRNHLAKLNITWLGCPLSEMCPTSSSNIQDIGLY